jgi:hypothetical protein
MTPENVSQKFYVDIKKPKFMLILNQLKNLLKGLFIKKRRPKAFVYNIQKVKNTLLF